MGRQLVFSSTGGSQISLSSALVCRDVYEGGRFAKQMLLGIRWPDDDGIRVYMVILWKRVGRSRFWISQMQKGTVPGCNLPSKGHSPSSILYLWADEGSVRKIG
jgi:hypothetical protein